MCRARYFLKKLGFSPVSDKFCIVRNRESHIPESTAIDARFLENRTYLNRMQFCIDDNTFQQKIRILKWVYNTSEEYFTWKRGKKLHTQQIKISHE